MDGRPNLHENLFSRNSTPPASNNSAPNLIDSLLHSAESQPESHPADLYDSNPLPADQPTRSSPTASVAERQNALLTLIGGPPPQQQPQSQPQPQQIPTPPGSHSSPPHNEVQKMLEQMITGTSSRSTTYSDTQRSNPSQPAPSPPYSQEYRSYNQYDQSNETSPRTRPLQQTHVPPPAAQQQPPSPRRSIFEFTSAFDHLSATGSVKKKPVPSQPSIAGEDSGSWPTVTDPKRQSVENLLENLTRGQPALAQQPQPPAYEVYLTSSDFSQVEHSPGRAPLPPIPAAKPVSIPNRTSSPHSSPPKSQPLHRPQPRPVDSSPSQQPILFSGNIPFPQSGGNRRDKDGSPARGGHPVRQKAVSAQTQPKYNTKPTSSPGPQTQVIYFNVSQPLDEIQARESVKWTPIALVKQDSVFLPGTTIGATHWVAYAMTRGRVRVISRSSGDRTLLQLPQVFSQTASVIDMAVYGNRLAGVTSDGGFVVWELPDLITDDVPGRLLLCVPPTTDPREAIRAVKWHPKDSNMVAIAAEDRVFVVDLTNTIALHGQPLPHSDLHHIGQLFTVDNPVVAFDFDVPHYCLATISEDSTLTIWHMSNSSPYAVHKIRGDDVPSSLTFVDGGIVVGRKNGTIFQLLSATNKAILSTINFVNGNQEDPDMFGHVSYDSRIQTLWVANSRRESLIALKIHLEPSFSGGEETVLGHIEQVAEFSGIKPTIHFVILTADADPHGDEAHAACVAAKITPGELALVGFSVHSTGVDQVLIRKEWFDAALSHADSKYPIFDLPHSLLVPETKSQPRQPLPPIPAGASQSQQPPAYPSPRARTPPSDDVDNEYSEARLSDTKSKAAKGKNVNWKEKDESGKALDKGAKPSDAAIINDSTLGLALSREIKKTEESLHSRIGKLIGKEMDKQHQRFEETRLHEQAEDFARQEKILKLISTELTRNTTRVVEMAVKNEVQNSVLPALENITRNEVKAALNDQVGISLVEHINRTLPVEMEKILLRPALSNHFGNLITSSFTPVIERQIKELLGTNFYQYHSQQTSTLHQDLVRELRSEVSAIKSDLGNWHNETVRTQEASIRELEHTVRALSDQVKFLSLSGAAPPPPIHHIQAPQQPQATVTGPPIPTQANINPAHLRQPNIPPANPPVAPYAQPHPPFQQQQQPVQPPPLQQQWYSPIAAPQASHPAQIQIPQASIPQPQQERTPPLKPDQWDENYLGVLHLQDPNKLRDLLTRTNPDLVFPLNGAALVSQAVILTLVHRLSAIIGETAPNDENFKNSLWWLQRVSSLLRPNDKLISDFIPRVIPTVQQSLNTTKQRLAILPGGLGTIETARQLTEIQEALRLKVTP
ncbi:hypothetical protein CPB84DRAFT_1705198 [Gymnopilus junonius]|uniref:Uncharacterized protein n=1 Tax=Gymnopilus junonius TaxID=109634 RepID=A0A9P5NVX6_GYMJU|nr:hypothetical protein CPB84DRAFT_1705198 [Gymnopilus junonius]